MQSLLPAEVAWYATGRFYVAVNGAISDVGYFIHLQGIKGRLFKGKRGERTASFTFASTPFRAEPLKNGSLDLGIDSGGEFSIYLNREAGATFEEPESFARGEKIATLRRVSIVVGTTLQSGTPPTELASFNVFSAELTWTADFRFSKHAYNLRRLIPHGITQWGTASTNAMASPPPGYAKVVPFVGSAIALGARP